MSKKKLKSKNFKLKKHVTEKGFGYKIESRPHIIQELLDIVYKGMYGRTEKQLEEDWGVFDIESAMTPEESDLFLRIANLTAELIYKGYKDPWAALNIAVERLNIKVITR